MLWIKSFHIIAMVTWFAGLFYLPRLYVYHASTKDRATSECFKIMEHKLFYYITTPGGVLTVALGLWLWFWFDFSGIWLYLKVGLVLLLMLYHYFCYRYLVLFKKDASQKSERFYRVFNEAPTLLLIAIVLLVVLKPFI